MKRIFLIMVLLLPFISTTQIPIQVKKHEQNCNGVVIEIRKTKEKIYYDDFFLREEDYSVIVTRNISGWTTVKKYYAKEVNLLSPCDSLSWKK